MKKTFKTIAALTLAVSTVLAASGCGKTTTDKDEQGRT